MYKFNNFSLSGDEDYENIGRFGKPIFDDLKDLSQNGLVIEGVNHNIDVVSSSDWKVQATIEGELYS